MDLPLDMIFRFLPIAISISNHILILDILINLHTLLTQLNLKLILQEQKIFKFKTIVFFN